MLCCSTYSFWPARPWKPDLKWPREVLFGPICFAKNASNRVDWLYQLYVNDVPAGEESESMLADLFDIQNHYTVTILTTFFTVSMATEQRQAEENGKQFKCKTSIDNIMIF